MKRIPLSGNAGLTASAVIQGVLGVEFVLSGLNKFADPSFKQDFAAFVAASPATRSGPLAFLIHQLIQPNVTVFAQAARVTELIVGAVLLVGALEVARRRLSGPLARQHGYEAAVALVAVFAGLLAAGLSLTIALLLGEQFPSIVPGRAFTTAIPVELLLVPFGAAVAWMEWGRFRVLRTTLPGEAGTHHAGPSQRVMRRRRSGEPRLTSSLPSRDWLRQ